MLSLDNVFNDDDLFSFNSRIRERLKIDSDIWYSAELKMDGVAVSIIYENGVLTRGATRGDGKMEKILLIIFVLLKVCHLNCLE